MSDLNTALDVLILAGYDINISPAGGDVRCTVDGPGGSAFAVGDDVTAALEDALQHLAHQRGRNGE